MKAADLTFAELDRQAGIKTVSSAAGAELSLPAWYRSIRDAPLRNLSAGDLARACRQNIHPDAVVPVAVTMLKSSLLAGDLYDGELLVSLKQLPSTFWKSSQPLAAEIERMIEEAGTSLPASLCDDVKALLLKLSGAGAR